MAKLGQAVVVVGGVGVALILALAGCSSTDDARDAGPADGAAVYARSCASCHGADLRGTERGPSHLSKVYEPGHHADAAFMAAIAKGSPQHHWAFGAMPPVPGLSTTEVAAVIAYIREAQEREGFEPYPPG